MKKIKELEPQKIIKFEAQNVKRIKAVQIEPDGNMVVIGGRNKQGKSSTLDSIMYAFAGGKAICDKPLRDDAEKGFVEIETEDLVIRRMFTRKNGVGSLTVKLKKGGEVKPPQSALNDICDKISFDPLAFLEMSPDEQNRQLMEIVGLDLSGFEAEKEELYNERRDLNRELKKLKSANGLMVSHPDIPMEERSIEELSAERTKAARSNDLIDKNIESLASLRARHKEIRSEIEDLEAELEVVAKDGKILSENENLWIKADLSEIDEKISDMQSFNQKARENKNKHDMEKDISDLGFTIEDIELKMDNNKDARISAISAVKMPVDGLSVDDGGNVVMNNVPFDQCSSAEQLQLSVSIGVANNPKLKLMLVRNGSLLDDDSMKLLANIASEAGVQVWVERVGNNDDGAIIIEDGCVLEDE